MGEGAVNPAATEARGRLSQLAADELIAVMRRRQLAPLVAAIAKGDKEGLVDEDVIVEARELVAALKAEPPRADPAPAISNTIETTPGFVYRNYDRDTHELFRPAHITDDMLAAVMCYASKKATAKQRNRCFEPLTQNTLTEN